MVARRRYASGIETPTEMAIDLISGCYERDSDCSLLSRTVVFNGTVSKTVLVSGFMRNSVHLGKII